MTRAGESLRLLLAINVIPLVALSLVGISWWQGGLSVQLPRSAVSVVALLSLGAVLSAALGFFAAPTAQQACIDNRHRRAVLRGLQSAGGLDFFSALWLRCRSGWLWLKGGALTVVSWAVHLALVATLLAILALAGLGAWLAWQMVLGRL